MRAAEHMGSAEPGIVPAGQTAAGRTTFIVRADPHTGRLVRSVALRSELVRNDPTRDRGLLKPTASKPSKEISDIVDRVSRTAQVDPLLVHSIIKVESNYNSFAISNKGAEGLMQLMPPTARMLGVSNSFDPQQNIEAGVKYLKYLQGVYKDDRLALAAYNAGPSAVEKYKQVPPYKETQNYVEQVGRRYENARRAAVDPAAEKADTADRNDAEKTGAGRALAQLSTAVPAPVVVENHPKLEQFVDEHGRLSLRTVE